MSQTAGMTGAPACGDVMKLQIKLDDDERIVDVKFKTYGCGSAIASSSAITELIKNKPKINKNISKNQ